MDFLLIMNWGMVISAYTFQNMLLNRTSFSNFLDTVRVFGIYKQLELLKKDGYLFLASWTLNQVSAQSCQELSPRVRIIVTVAHILSFFPA